MPNVCWTASESGDVAGVVVDTSALLAFFDFSEPDHAAVAGVLERDPGPLVVSPYVIAEFDYLVATRHGVEAELAVLSELASGSRELPRFDHEELGRMRSVIGQHRDQAIGAADASNVILADRYRTRGILTLDRCHFEVLGTGEGDPFTIHPA